MFNTTELPRPGWKILHVRHSNRKEKGYIPEDLFEKLSAFSNKKAHGPLNSLTQHSNYYKLWNLIDRAFDQDVLPNLEVLAIGDFSYNCRYEGQYKLFKRDAGSLEGFAEADPSELSEITSVEDPMEFLGACPTGTYVP